MTRARPPPPRRSIFSVGASSSPTVAASSPASPSSSGTESDTIPSPPPEKTEPAPLSPQASPTATHTDPAAPVSAPSSPVTDPPSTTVTSSPPIPLIQPSPGNADCNAREFQEEVLYDFPTFAASSHTQHAIELCRKYFLEPFMLPREFFYFRIIRAFYQTMTTRDKRHPEAIYFEIDGRQGVLSAEAIAEALGIPLTPLRRADFQPATPCSVQEQVTALASGPPTYTTAILRRELDPSLWLVDHVLRSNLHPCQHSVQRRGDFLHALYSIAQGQWFSASHLVMTSLFYFEEKVHRKKLARANKLPLLLPRLLCLVLERMGFPADPSKERRYHCREIFGLSRWHGVCARKGTLFERAFSSSSVEHHYTPPAELHTDLQGDGPDSPVHHSTPPTLGTNGSTSAAVAPASPITPPTLAVPSSAGSSHVAVPAADFSSLCSQVAVLQASNTQLLQRIEELTALVTSQQHQAPTPPTTASTSVTRSPPPPEFLEDPPATTDEATQP